MNPLFCKEYGRGLLLIAAVRGMADGALQTGNALLGMAEILGGDEPAIRYCRGRAGAIPEVLFTYQDCLDYAREVRDAGERSFAA